MSSTDLLCEGPCPPLPEGFVRLRYFFGKRLGVADLKDEQAYHRNKIQLHNRHLHGHGVVCGLGLSIFDNGDPSPTVVRVGAGLALDTCGHEVVVPYDQCIDLAAWFQRRLVEAEARNETFPPDVLVTNDRLMLCIAVRYLECPITPEPAPADPCACDTGGCEYGRVQERFELKVMLEDEAADYLQPLPPGEPGQPCPEGRDPDWTILGCLFVTLADDAVMTLEDPSAWMGPPVILRPTAWLQAQPPADGGDGDPEPPPPPPPPVELTLTDIEFSEIAIDFPVAPIPETAVPGAFALRRLDPGSPTGWEAPDDVEVVGVEGRRVVVRFGALLTTNALYRMVTPAGPEGVVDASLRPLQFDLSFSINNALQIVITSIN